MSYFKEWLHTVNGDWKVTRNENGVTALHAAAHDGLIETLHICISNGANVNAQDYQKSTPLHYLAKGAPSSYEFTQVLKLLTENGADINLLDENGNNPLFIAVLNGKSVGELKLLQSYGAAWRNVKNKTGSSILHMAIPNTNLEALSHFLMLRADINAVDNERNTVLHYAAQSNTNCKETVIRLLSKNMVYNEGAVNKNGETFLQILAAHGNVDCLNFLVTEKKMNANIKNSRGRTLLHFATRAKINFNETVTLLLSFGLDINEVDENGNPPLFLAIANRKSKTELEHLMSHGASWKIVNTCHKMSALHLAAQYGHTEALSLLLFLGGVDINGLNKVNETPLCCSVLANENFVETVQLLVENGADINEVIEDGDNLILIATEEGRSRKELEQLVWLGARWYEKNCNGSSILHYAAVFGNLEALSLFLFLGAVQVNGVDKFQRTPLHCTAFSKEHFMEMVMLLIDFGADINKVDEDGESLIHIATEEGKSRKELQQLIDLGARCHEKNNNGSNILHYAAQFGNLEALSLFLSLRFVEVNGVNKFKRTPLHYTARAEEHFMEMVMLLIEHGADLNAVDEDGENLVFFATREGKSRQELEQLLNLGASRNIKSRIYDDGRGTESETSLTVSCENFTELEVESNISSVNESDTRGVKNWNWKGISCRNEGIKCAICLILALVWICLIPYLLNQSFNFLEKWG